MLLAAKRAAQVPAPPVPRIGQKEYPAMFASRPASSKVWLGPSGSTAEGSNTAVQAAQPDYRDTIFGEIQTVGGFLI